MHEHPGNRGVIPASTLLVAIMVVGGVYLTEPTLKTLRPTEPDAFQYSFLESEAIQVPAWEDPWVAINKERQAWLGHEEGKPMPASFSLLSDLRKEIDNRVGHRIIEDKGSDDSPAAKVEVMIVMTTAGGQHSAIETRRRQRYALMSAMAATGYQQTSPRNVGHLIVPRLRLDEREKSGVAKIDPEFGSIAFDWFKLNSSAKGKGSAANAEHVLVLWVQSDMLQRHAFVKLAAYLSGALSKDLMPGRKSPVSISVLGPDDSMLLQKQLIESQAIRAETDQISSACLGDSIQRGNLIFGLSQTAGGAIDYRRSGTESTGKPWDQWRQAPTAECPDSSTLIASIQDELLEYADFYLDEPMGKEQRDTARECFAGDNAVIEDCLKQLQIEDSDTNWEALIASVAQYPITRAKELTDFAASVSMDAAYNKERLAQTLWVADDYLDDGLPLNSELAVCLNNADSISDHVVARCIGELDLEDSDAQWKDTIAGHITNTPPLDRTNAKDCGIQQKACAINDLLGQINVWSPRATIPLRRLVQDKPFESSIAEQLGVSQFTSMIADDYQVFETIQTELTSRGIHLCRTLAQQETCSLSENKHSEKCTEDVAIMLDSTSYYGPEIPRIVDEMCEGRPNVRFWGYVQRVDGAGDPGSSKGRAEQASGLSNLMMASPTAVLNQLPVRELSAGPHQLDYARRLGEQVVRDARRNGAGVRAVGVLGPDIYDKLLIFQGIRSAAPGVLLFTTDLDAAYSHPNAREWANNLLVGSAFGLEPPERQKDNSRNALLSAPPFRDAYQTALYRAVRAALKHEPFRPNITSPVLHEVGRRGFVELTKHCSGEGCDADYNQPASEGWTTLEARFSTGFWMKLSFLSIPLLLMIVKAAAMRRDASKRIQLRGGTTRDNSIKDPVLDAYRKELRWATFALVFLIEVLFFLLVYMALAHTPNREPFLLFDGVSGIPTLVMWCSVIALSISFLIMARVRFSSSNRELNEYFALQCPTPQWNKRSLWGTLRTAWIAPWASAVRVAKAPMHSLRPVPERLATAQSVWKDYRTLGSWQARATRIVVLTAVWSLIVWNILNQQPLQALVRGIDQDLLTFTRCLTVLCVLFIIAMAGDAMKLCKVFIQAISLDPLQWKHTPDRDLTKGLDEYVANRVASMEIIARRTETIGQVIFYPFLLIGLLLIARSSLFEGWVLNGDLVLVYGFFILYLFVRMIGLQREADAARSRIVSNLRRYQYKVRMQVASGEAELPLAKRALKNGVDQIDEDLERLIDYVESIRRGAFQPVLQHPMFQAIAWPSTGIGLIALLQLLL